MKPALQSLCTATFLLLLTGAEAGGHAPTAVRKLSPDSGEKLLREHLAFAPLLDQLPDGLSPFGIDNNIAGGYNDEYGSARFYRAFGAHRDNSESNVFRRAAEALALLQERSSCPPNMESCADMGSPNKCCQEGTYCTDVPDTMVGHVACCPDDTTCGGGVGDCPSDAVSCPPDLGGGCCLGGWICQGIGCVTSTEATPTATETEVHTTTAPGSAETITTTQTTIIEGEPSTVVVTMTVTQFPSEEPSTSTKTETVTASQTSDDDDTETPTSTGSGDDGDGEGTGGAPWRPTVTTDEDTQTGCPTGFYGCLATHGGGCCRTDRDCETHSCPPPSSTTLADGHVTVVVPNADGDVPASATATCAGGWFLCGDEGGPVPGCCPSGYDCGTASCFSAMASQTAQVQKEFPEGAAALLRSLGVIYLSGLALLVSITAGLV